MTTERQQGRGGMGSHKHGISGHGGPSPKSKLMRALDANREEAARPKRRTRTYQSVADLMRQEKPK
jgi:hypothetical protein